MISRLRCLRYALLPALIATAAALRADVIPNALFADHAVLQRDKPIPVWGQAEPGEKVTVRLGGLIAESTTADAKGNWSVRLPAQPAGGPYSLVFEGKNRVERTDIWLGEVWVCSGQSNMDRKLGLNKNQKPLENWEQEAASANYPQIRHFYVARTPSDTPRTATTGKWDVCSPQTSVNFTAVGYYFARDLQRKLNVAVGLINSSWGGTPAEAWMRRDVLDADFPETLAAQEKAIVDYEAALAKFKADEPALLKTWEEKAAVAKAAGKPAPARPSAPGDPRLSANRPSSLYQGMIVPLQPYALRGVIWYQGESNAKRAEAYRTLFPALIRDWRAQWGQGEFPFLFVQIAPFNGQPPEIRDAQLHAWRTTPNTAMVVTTDAGDANDIHPARKEPVGVRLALAARALAYGEKLDYSGPVYRSATVVGSKVTLAFDHLGGGLVAKDGPLRGFTLSADGKTFVPAQAEVVGDTVVLHAETISKPVEARYGWANVPDVNLFNAAGLPASPFRTGPL
ncbi:MAG: sialate O-acetylesterase [Verrucomicrobia bacterium]|nr:sialate O-acetylesterase [Verrucomicrobiota bacterium]